MPEDFRTKPITRAPLDPASSDREYNGLVDQVQNLISQLSFASGGSGRSLPIIREVFLGYTSPAPDGFDNYTNAQYWIRRAVPLSADDADDQLTVRPDELGNSGAYPSYITATNQAELLPQSDSSTSGGDGTHLLANYQPVIVFAFPHRASPLKKSYVFNFAKPPALIPVTLTVYSYSIGPGSPTANADYTYIMNDAVTGVQIGASGLSPSGNREQRTLTGPATIGIARVDSSGTYLWWCDERALAGACE